MRRCPLRASVAVELQQFARPLRRRPPAWGPRKELESRMKKLLLVTASLVALGAAAPAMAAGLAARPYTNAPAVVEAAYNWGGFYVDLNGGGGPSHKCWDIAGLSEGCHDATGG